MLLQHPDITAMERDGYPSGHKQKDCPELRVGFAAENGSELAKWMGKEYPDVLDMFIDSNMEDYDEFLN